MCGVHCHMNNLRDFCVQSSYLMYGRYLKKASSYFTISQVEFWSLWRLLDTCSDQIELNIFHRIKKDTISMNHCSIMQRHPCTEDHGPLPTHCEGWVLNEKQSVNTNILKCSKGMFIIGAKWIMKWFNWMDHFSTSHNNKVYHGSCENTWVIK